MYSPLFKTVNMFSSGNTKDLICHTLSRILDTKSIKISLKKHHVQKIANTERKIPETNSITILQLFLITTYICQCKCLTSNLSICH